MSSGKAGQVKRYWEEHARSWEQGAYFQHLDRRENLRLWDRLAALFRGDIIQKRFDLAVELLAPHVRGLAVLDIGCASGRLASRLLEVGASRVIGVDVSASVIGAANQFREESGLQDKLEFIQGDVTAPEMELPEVDLAVSLGVIEYFDSAMLESFISRLRARYLFFDSLPTNRGRGLSPLWLLRGVYLKVYRCPGVFLHRPEDFSALASRYGFPDVRLVSRSNLNFVTNLPA